MSVTGLQTLPIRETVAYEDYARLLALRSLNKEQLAQLKQLMIDLGLTVRDVEADEKIVKQIAELRQRIDAARHLAPKLNEATTERRHYEKETEQLLAQRKPEQERLSKIESDIQSAISDAHEAVDKINDLKARHPQLLAHEQRATPANLAA